MEDSHGSIKNYLGIINHDTLLIKSIARDKVLKEISLKGVKVEQSDTCVSLTNRDVETDDSAVI